MEINVWDIFCNILMAFCFFKIHSQQNIIICSIALINLIKMLGTIFTIN